MVIAEALLAGARGSLEPSEAAAALCLLAEGAGLADLWAAWACVGGERDMARFNAIAAAALAAR